VLRLCTLLACSLLGASNWMTASSHNSEVARPALCIGSSWTAPAKIRYGQQDVVARFPSLVAGQGGTYLAGNDIPYFDETAIGPTSGVFVRLGHGDIGRPVGDFAFAFPRLSAGARGEVVAIWGEPSLTDTPVSMRALFPSMRIASIWSAVYTLESGWSPAERVHVGREVRWLLSDAPVQGTATDVQATAVVSTDSSGVTELVVLTRKQGTWSSQVVRRGTMSGYASLATRADTTLIAFLAAGTPGSGKDVNSVYAMASSGREHADPLLLSRSGGNAAAEIQSLIDKQGRFHLIWSRGGRNGTWLHHAVSTNNAKTWAADSMPVASGVDGLHAAVDLCDDVNVVYEHWSADGEHGHLDHAVLGGSGTVPTHLFPDIRATSATLAADAEGNLAVVFLGQTATEPLTAPIASYMAHLTSQRK